MGTRSDIIVKRADGSWARTYCHWDGYLENNGRILFNHYKTQAKADALVALGDLSSLGKEIGEKHPFEAPRQFAPGGDFKTETRAYKAFQKKYGNMCTAYGRDRGETGTEATIGETLQEVWPDNGTGTEFTYVWDGKRWFVGDPDEGTQALVELGAALEGKVSITPNVKAFGVNMVIGKHKRLNPDAKNKSEHSWTWYQSHSS